MHYSDYARTAKNWSHTDPLPRHQWLYETPVVIIEENELPQWKSPEQILQAPIHRHQQAPPPPGTQRPSRLSRLRPSKTKTVPRGFWE